MLRYKQIVLLWLISAFSLLGQTPAAIPVSTSTNAPSAVPPPVTAIAIGDVVNQAESELVTLQDEQSQLTADQVVVAANTQILSLAKRIDDRLSTDRKLLATEPTLSDLQKAQDVWQAITKDLSSTKSALTDRANQLETMKTQLTQKSQIWKATLVSASAASTGVPPEVVARIKAVRAAIDATSKSAQALQPQILSTQSRLSEQELRIGSGKAIVVKAEDDARGQLFKQDRPPLWAGSFISTTTANVSQENNSFQDQVGAVQDYLSEHLSAVGIHALILVLLTLGLYRIRAPIRTRAIKETALQNTEQVFASPFATAILLSLLAFPWLYPLAPRLLTSAVGALALIPTVIILRRLLEPPLYPILYALVTSYLVDRLRYVLIPEGTLGRLLLILELLAGSIFIIWLFRSKRLATQLAATRFDRWVRPYLHLTLWMFVFAGLVNILGYVQLSVLVSKGMLSSSYLTLVFYAAVRIIDALIFSLLSIPPLSHFRMVDSHRKLIYFRASNFLNWVALGMWLLVALQVFQLRGPAWHVGKRILQHPINWGSISFNLEGVVAFGLTVWASFLISRFLRFVLAEEVYPHLSLARGIPYAASTMVHYAILLMGFFLALGALGFPLSQYTVLLGAFSVGLGFGLQNIMNNFVSGIILLFERPIKVGDTLQMDAVTGVVESIGIRASVIRLSSGASIIMPNGNLISSPVTNWSLRDNRRMIEVPISVNSKVDPQHVLDLLLQAAQADKQALKDPAPQAVLVTLSATGLAFKLRVYVNSEADWTQVTSDLTLAINSALAKEGILFA